MSFQPRWQGTQAHSGLACDLFHRSQSAALSIGRADFYYRRRLLLCKYAWTARNFLARRFGRRLKWQKRWKLLREIVCWLMLPPQPFSLVALEKPQESQLPARLVVTGAIPTTVLVLESCAKEKHVVHFGHLAAFAACSQTRRTERDAGHWSCDPIGHRRDESWNATVDLFVAGTFFFCTSLRLSLLLVDSVWLDARPVR